MFRCTWRFGIDSTPIFWWLVVIMIGTEEELLNTQLILRNRQWKVTDPSIYVLSQFLRSYIRNMRKHDRNRLGHFDGFTRLPTPVECEVVLEHHIHISGARSSAIGWSTVLLAGRSPVRFPTNHFGFYGRTYISSRTMALGSTQPLT
jgi:hypothetical protein